MTDKLDQLEAFYAWECVHNPAPENKYHISRWAIDEIKRLRAEIDDLRARVAMLEAEADENAGSAITAMPIQIGDDLCYLPVNAHGIVKMALMECSAAPVYIPPMIDVSADIHPDEIAGFERGAQSALNYVFNMGPLYTKAKVPHK